MFFGKEAFIVSKRLNANEFKTDHNRITKYGCVGMYIGFMICLNTPTIAQSTTTQLWTDFTVNIPLNRGYTFANEFAYRTALNKNTGWFSLNLTPEIEKSINRKLDVVFFMGYTYTDQQVNDNTWEINPAIGFRYHFTPGKKVLLRLFARLEQRNQYTIETELLDHDFRTRLRLESIIFMNGKSFAENHIWYTLLDAEAFWTTDQEYQERYSNRFRIRSGAGYKINGNWRVEGIFSYQFSKNTIEGEISDNQQEIIRLRIKYFTK